MKMKAEYDFHLASNSPRRRSMLSYLGYHFSAEAIETDESYPSDIPKDQVAEYLAKKKNSFHRKLFPDRVLVTADTTVLCKGQLLEKPTSSVDAERMLKILSGTSHQVISGICVTGDGKEISSSQQTEVFFKDLTDEDISHYVTVYKPLDKAGAYGIQEWIGMIGIKKIVGSYFNVVGLPLDVLHEVLTKEFKISPLR
ncbi:MAG: septum formation protein [Cyclobacteriaceae bacterium]|jgi:septum formation protein